MKFLSCEKNQFFSLFFLMFIIFFIFNSLTPHIADDYSYVYSFEDGERITGIVDILKSQYAHWHNWGGRSIAHTLTQIFIMFPKIVFNIMNSLIYCIFIFLCYRHIIGKNNIFRPSLVILLNLYFWIFLPVYGQNIFWLTGSCNYLWTTVLILIFLLPYRMQIEDANNSMSPVISILFFFSGVLAGWSNENSGASILGLLILYLLYKKLVLKVHLQSWEISGIVGFLAGFSLLILAPGNFNRLAEINVDQNGFFSIIERIYDLCSFYFRIGIVLPIIFLLPLIFNKKKNGIDTESIVMLAYPIGAILGIYSMIVSPTFPDRATMIAYTYSGISLIQVFNVYREKKYYSIFGYANRRIKIISILLLTMVFLISSLLPSIKNMVEVSIKSSYRDHYIRKNSEVSSEKIELGIIKPHNKHVSLFGLSDLNESGKVWPNPVFAEYFGVKEVVGSNDHSWWPSYKEMFSDITNRLSEDE